MNVVKFSMEAPQNSQVSLFNDQGAPKAQATVLIEIGKLHHLFHDADGGAYARVTFGSHAEVFHIASSAYGDLLGREYFMLSGVAANRRSIADAVATITAIARYGVALEPVHLRVGSKDCGIVIDIGAEDWSVIEVTANGWQILGQHNVNFRRSTKAMALPIPTEPDFELIWKYVNVEKTDRVLVAALILASLCPHGPFPILLLQGEQGSGKSFSSRILKALTDPSSVPLRPSPRDETDLLVSALNSRVLALDNLSGATPQLSDALCRLATGGALARRMLYTDIEESAHEIKRPVILNGIDDLASRPDLAERCIHLELPTLTIRNTESDMKNAFKSDAPAIMAAVLDGLVMALRDHRNMAIAPLPRMADFAKWAAAGLPALGFAKDDFLAAYRRNQADVTAMGLDASVVASTIRELVHREGRIQCTARQLLNRINKEAGVERKSPGWPQSPKGLHIILSRLKPLLRSIDIHISRHRDCHNQYITDGYESSTTLPQVPQVPLCHSPVADDGGMVDMAVPIKQSADAQNEVLIL